MKRRSGVRVCESGVSAAVLTAALSVGVGSWGAGYGLEGEPTGQVGVGQPGADQPHAGQPDAGQVGNADEQLPPGQSNGSGYECNDNEGVGHGNPAHSSCSSTDPPTDPADGGTAPGDGTGAETAPGHGAGSGTPPGSGDAASTPTESDNGPGPEAGNGAGPGTAGGDHDGDEDSSADELDPADGAGTGTDSGNGSDVAQGAHADSAVVAGASLEEDQAQADRHDEHFAGGSESAEVNRAPVPVLPQTGSSSASRVAGALGAALTVLGTAMVTWRRSSRPRPARGRHRKTR